MLVGLDFDNTIVRYDQLFHRLAVERGLIPPGVSATKQSVRDYLRAADREVDWTELQGIAYGPRINGIAEGASLDEVVEQSLRRAAIWEEVKDRLRSSALGLSGGFE